MNNLFDFYKIVNSLKFTKRRGWVEKGLDSDSIAAHSFGAASLGWFIAKSEKINTQKVVDMLLIHDYVMAKMEDVTPQSGKYGEKREMEEAAKIEIIKSLPEEVKNEYQILFDEFQAQETKEAIVAREADKIETLLQGDSYEEQAGQSGILNGFFESYETFIKTSTGRKIFDEIKKRHESRQI